MSIKDQFDGGALEKSLINKSAQQVGDEVESVKYVEADLTKENRFIPPVDLSKPENFARYGSAKEYYTKAVENIYKSYPYDGSLYERTDWENSSSYIDLYIFENQYPRTNGYINFSYGGWGSHGSAPTPANAGYGKPKTSDLEYISIKGGPGIGGGPQSQGANIWDVGADRQSNLELDLVSGSTVEFWLKKEAFDTTKTHKEVVFDLWNSELTSSNLYGRLRIDLTGSSAADAGADPFRLTLMSGTVGFQTASVCASTFTTASITDNKWHHYAISVKSASAGILTRFYVDGDLNNETILGTAILDGDSSVGIDNISGSMVAYIGALRTNISGNNGIYHSLNMTGSGKLDASLDEFRYWKTQRSSQDIGRYWFTQVGGGTNTDTANTDLGVYYKFNEGITGIAATDSVVLDYAGRVTNGAWTGYTGGARVTASAIVESSASATEFKDPIIYSTHPAVKAKLSALQSSGSAHDHTNNANLFYSFPTWMQEEDSVSGNGLNYLTQIMGSYFDSLHLEIEALGGLQDFGYLSGSDKPNVYANRLLENRGILAPELFFDADILEKLADRSEDRLFVKSLNDIKNIIYKNIYNNLVNIYKTKGTYKSFRNLIRCFGIDEEILKLNMYGNNVEYELRDNRTNIDTKERLADFVTVGRQGASVFQYSSSANSNTTNYITGSINLTGGYASTLEVDVLFPKKLSQDSPVSPTQDFIHLTSSLFGVHTALVDRADPADTHQTTWDPADAASVQVYAIRDETNSENVRFLLTSSYGAFTPVSSSLYNEVYNNTRWNLSVRTKPLRYPQVNHVVGTTGTLLNEPNLDSSYIIELHGIQTEAGYVANEFNITSSIDPNQIPLGFITGSKRVYVGAHRQDFTGSLLASSDVRVAGCRYWLDYLSNDTLKYHAYDIKNFGAIAPFKNSYLFQNDLSKLEVPQIDTLALNWDFNQVTSSNASGEFFVADFSSGSTELANNRYGWLGPILNSQHSGKGYGFPVSSTQVVDVDYIISARQNHPENLYSEDMIKILSQQDQREFTQDSRPITFFFAFEKSMYRVVSDEILNMFASIVDFNNLVGQPVNKYRDRYKQLGKLRQLFFERVQNTPNLDKYIEYYKWFDSSLNVMLQQLIPASADFSDKVRTVV
ncbi:hypothetical protein CL634_03475, partial [bacterium]|nr:hypothetical protein [bacterium]